MRDKREGNKEKEVGRGNRDKSRREKEVKSGKRGG
jgi:hypothetical protein